METSISRGNVMGPKPIFLKEKLTMYTTLKRKMLWAVLHLVWANQRRLAYRQVRQVFFACTSKSS